MSYRVTFLSGDAAGDELFQAVSRLIDAAGVKIEWLQLACGEKAVAEGKDALSDEVIEAIKSTTYALKGEYHSKGRVNFESPNVALRKALDLYAVVRPIKSMPGVKSRYEDVDFTVVRESTEDVYSGIEHEVVEGVVQSIKITTEKASERIIRKAYEIAQRENRKKVTLLHKANIMKLADGLFLRVGKRIAAEFPDIEFNSLIADNACMQLVQNPTRYGVIVAQNLFGDLTADLGAGIVGGNHAVYGLVEGDGPIKIFEAIHSYNDDLAGKGVVNPLPMIRPALALLKELGEVAIAERLEKAVALSLESGAKCQDEGGEYSTEGMVDAILAHF